MNIEVLYLHWREVPETTGGEEPCVPAATRGAGVGAVWIETGAGAGIVETGAGAGLGDAATGTTVHSILFRGRKDTCLGSTPHHKHAIPQIYLVSCMS